MTHMQTANIHSDTLAFSEVLFERMKSICPCLQKLEAYEFRYCLQELLPEEGWGSIKLDDMAEIETRRVKGILVLDPEIVHLSRMLFVGIVTGAYPLKWVKRHFYFDARGFYFLHRTTYFTAKMLAHLGGKPYRLFEQKQRAFEDEFEIGYQAFKEANAEVDGLFIQSVMKLIAARGTPILLAIAGATAAGKTEIVERLCASFTEAGQKVTSIELDNFLTDREEREARGIDSRGREAIHFELFRKSLEDITHGKKITIPHYDTVLATSSHDLAGNLKPGRKPIEIEPADIIFIEGNFPFLIEEVLHLIDIKVVYLTDDPVRMKRKWRRDIDFRKKFDPTYFRNRYFREQFIMAEVAYLPQMEVCDMLVDTTGAALWVTPEVAKTLDGR
jgi:uridine kinase